MFRDPDLRRVPILPFSVRRQDQPTFNTVAWDAADRTPDPLLVEKQQRLQRQQQARLEQEQQAQERQAQLEQQRQQQQERAAASAAATAASRSPGRHESEGYTGLPSPTATVTSGAYVEQCFNEGIDPILPGDRVTENPDQTHCWSPTPAVARCVQLQDHQSLPVCTPSRRERASVPPSGRRRSPPSPPVYREGVERVRRRLFADDDEEDAARAPPQAPRDRSPRRERTPSPEYHPRSPSVSPPIPGGSSPKRARRGSSESESRRQRTPSPQSSSTASASSGGSSGSEEEVDDGHPPRRSRSRTP